MTEDHEPRIIANTTLTAKGDTYTAHCRCGWLLEDVDLETAEAAAERHRQENA